MMTLLRGLHSIAAQRGDGLRPELLQMMTPSPAWAGVERMGGATAVDNAGVRPADDVEPHARSAEVVAMPRRERDENR